MLPEWLGGCGSCEGLWPGGLRGGWAGGWNSGCGLPAFRDCGASISNGPGCGSPVGWGRGCDAPFGWDRGYGAPIEWGRGYAAPTGWSCGCGWPIGRDFGCSEQWNFDASSCCNCGDNTCACGYRWCECPECNPLGGYGDGPCGGYVSYRDRYHCGC